MNKRISVLVLGALLIGGVGGGIALYKPETTAKGTVIHSDALLVKMSKEDLLKESDAVIVGQVTKVESFRAPSEIRPGKEDIVSHASITVSDYLYNPKLLTNSEITVQFLGGEIDGAKMVVEDGPAFEQGQQVIAFLKQKDAATFTVVGWAQGKYTVDSNGIVGIGEEQAFARNLFGRPLTVDEFKEELVSNAE